MKIKIIVACCNNNGIGIKNKLPWSIKEELEFFKNITIGNGNNAVIMGRKTFESLPKILEKRDNLILTKSPPTNTLDKEQYFTSIEEVVNHCNSKNYETVWVIGGANIYKQFISKNFACEIYQTRIFNNYECDCFFPEIPIFYNLKEIKNIKNIDPKIAKLIIWEHRLII